MTPQLQIKSKLPSGKLICSASISSTLPGILNSLNLCDVISAARLVKSMPVKDLQCGDISCACVPCPTPISSTSLSRSSSNGMSSSKGTALQGMYLRTEVRKRRSISLKYSLLPGISASFSRQSYRIGVDSHHALLADCH